MIFLHAYQREVAPDRCPFCSYLCRGQRTKLAPNHPLKTTLPEKVCQYFATNKILDKGFSEMTLSGKRCSLLLSKEICVENLLDLLVTFNYCCSNCGEKRSGWRQIGQSGRHKKRRNKKPRSDKYESIFTNGCTSFSFNIRSSDTGTSTLTMPPVFQQQR